MQEIHARGHEVASHGYNHELCSNLSMEDLRNDLYRSKALLEDITGQPAHGYRAPSFSISDEVLKVIEQCGYLYDSSYNSFAMHGRYGCIHWGGGGYFRLIPAFLFKWGVRQILLAYCLICVHFST